MTSHHKTMPKPAAKPAKPAAPPAAEPAPKPAAKPAPKPADAAAAGRKRKAPETESEDKLCWKGVTFPDTEATSRVKTCTCKYCGHVFKANGPSRVKAHLRKNSGFGVKECNPTDNEKSAAHTALLEEMDKSNLHQDAKRANNDPRQSVLQLVRQPSVDDVRRAIRDFVYDEALPFQIVESESFKELCGMLHRFSGHKDLDLPDRKELAGPMLSEAVNVMETHTNEVLQAGAHKGLTVIHDGWTDKHMAPVLSYHVCTTRAARYVKNIFPGKTKKSDEYISDELVEFIVGLGDLAASVVHFCVDGANNRIPLVEAKCRVSWSAAVCVSSMPSISFSRTCSIETRPAPSKPLLGQTPPWGRRESL